jgi:hypothetical protein
MGAEAAEEEVCGWTNYHVRQRFRIQQCLLGPWMEEHKDDGGRRKTSAEAGLRVYGRLLW